MVLDDFCNILSPETLVHSPCATRAMILKSVSLVIAGLIVGGEAVANHMRDITPLPSSTVDTPPTSIASATVSSSATGSYFTTSWTGFQTPTFRTGQNISFEYTIGADIDQTAYLEQIPELMLLYTTAQTVPNTSNTYEVMSVYCKNVSLIERLVLIQRHRHLQSTTRNELVLHTWCSGYCHT